MLGPAAAVPVAFGVPSRTQCQGEAMEEDGEEARAGTATTKQEKGIPIVWAISGGATEMGWMDERDPVPSATPYAHSSIRALVW